MANVVKQMLPLADPGFPRQGGGWRGHAIPVVAAKTYYLARFLLETVQKLYWRLDPQMTQTAIPSRK